MSSFEEAKRQLLPWEAPGEPSRRLGLLALCIVLIAIFGMTFDNFFTVSNGLATALNLSSMIIAGVGSAYLLVSGNVDLSIGSQWAFGSMLIGLAAQSAGGVVLPVLVALGAGLLMGLANGVLVTRLAISPLIVTLGMNLVYNGLAFVVSRGRPVFGFSDGFTDIGRGSLFGVPLPVVIAFSILLVGGAGLVGTRFGLRVFAVGENTEAAVRNGIDANRTVIQLFAFNGLLVGIVSLLTVSRFNTATPQVGATFALGVLTAVILGGVSFSGGQGHPLGVFMGIITIGILDTGLLFAGVEDWWQRITRGGLLLLALGADQILLERRSRARQRKGATADDKHIEHDPTGGPPQIELDRSSGSVALRCDGLKRNFGAVQAVRDASFDVRHGQIVCLVGDNGAGKSTVVKMLSGIIEPTGGHIAVDGQRLEPVSVETAKAAGVQTVYQDLAVCPGLSVTHNLVLGDEPMLDNRIGRFFGIRDDRTARQRALRRIGSLGTNLENASRLMRDLSGGQRQSVAIARALEDETSLMILDEPTAALGVKQTERVLDTARAVADAGAGVLLITHDVDTVLNVADRVVVMRTGSVVFDGDVSNLDQVKLVHLMAGLTIEGQLVPQDDQPATSVGPERGTQ